MIQLLAGRWSTDGATLLEQFANPANIGIRVNIRRAFGVDRIEVTVKCANEYDMHDRMSNHLGQRLAVYSSWLARPISGYILQITKVGRNQIQYIARGIGWRHDDRLIQFNSELGDTLTTAINDWVTATYVEPLASTRSIATNNTPSAWLSLTQQTTPGDLMRRIIEYDNNGSGMIYDYYCYDKIFSGTSLSDFLPVYEQRVTDAAPAWVVRQSDMSSWRLSRDLEDFATRSTVRYGLASGAVTTGGSTTVFTDATLGDFINQGVVAGDYVYNRTAGSYATVTVVNSATQITHTPLRDETGATGVNWAVTDVYAVIARAALLEQTAPTTPDDTPWRKDVQIINAQLDSATADNFAEQLISNEAKGVQSFTITAPFISDSDGREWPLWEVCAQLDKRTIQIIDAYPAASLFDTSSDNITTFYIAGLDYDHSSRSLTVEVDQLDKRMDVRLRLAGITKSDAIRRGR